MRYGRYTRRNNKRFVRVYNGRILEMVLGTKGTKTYRLREWRKFRNESIPDDPCKINFNITEG